MRSRSPPRGGTAVAVSQRASISLPSVPWPARRGAVKLTGEGTPGAIMDNGIAGIDHVIVGVRDLERARMGWSRLGFTLSPRGRHIGQGTANCCIMFESDYVELLGIVDPNDFVQRLDMFLAQREGLMAAAFAPAGGPEEV